MAVDAAELRNRIDAGCKARIVRSGRRFVVVLDGPAPSGVVCVRDKRKEFPSPQHAADWLASLSVPVQTVTSGTHEEDEGAWLRPAFVECSACNTVLFRVDHSPFYDEWFFYCDTCAKRAEVSCYDPVVSSIEAATPADKLREVEARLRPCSCGGSFRLGAPRRCPTCCAIVIVDEDAVDLWPAFFGSSTDPTEEQQQEVAQFEAKHVRRAALWR